MLRSYVLSPQSLKEPLRTAAEIRHLLALLGELHERVMITVPDTAMDFDSPNGSIFRLIDANVDRAGADEARILIEEECKRERDSGLVVVATRGKRCGETAILEVLKTRRVHAVLASQGSALSPKLSRFGVQTQTFAEAAKDLKRTGRSKALKEFRSRQELDRFLAPFFWRPGQISIIDPYVGASAVKPDQRSHESFLEAVEWFVERSIECTRETSETNRLSVVTSRRKYKAELKKHPAYKEGDLANRERLDCIRLTDSLRQMFKQRRVPDCQIDVSVRMEEDFLIRGIVSSGRVWQLEHSLQDLAAMLRSLSPNGRYLKPKDEWIVQLAAAEVAKVLRELAAPPRRC